MTSYSVHVYVSILTRFERERDRWWSFRLLLRPGELILRHRYRTLLGFGSCEITVGNQSLFDIFFNFFSRGSSEIRTRDLHDLCATAIPLLYHPHPSSTTLALLPLTNNHQPSTLPPFFPTGWPLINLFFLLKPCLVALVIR